MAHSGQQLTAGVIVAVFDRWFEPGACSLVQAERIAALLVTWQRGWWAWSVVEGHATRSLRHDTECAAAGGRKP
jgi:hypothetical protein